MEKLLAMGFEPFKCERALEAAQQDVQAAIDFVLANTDQPAEWWRAGPTAGTAGDPDAQQPSEITEFSASASQSAEEQAVIREAFEAFSSASDALEADVKGHCEAPDHVQLYIDQAFATRIIQMRKNAYGEWISERDPGDECNMEQRDEKHRVSHGWMPLN